MNAGRVPAKTLGVSAAILAAWIASEGFAPKPEIPTKGDVPTIGHGATHYEDGRRVTMADPPITRQRAAELAENLLEGTYAQCVRKSLGDTLIHPVEFAQAVDFAGQYGCYRWQQSSMARETKAGNYSQACDAYLLYRFAAGYDCSTLINGLPNKRCWGVWDRQLQRNAKCEAVQ
ncbi:Phage-related lysozyme (muraminidase) [Variovorax sp. PBS-H4]|uniref:glycoside hydrolase family protein n=1 Tax=Variovorax sp. PBS-H4 TaxID=434008 RepID=UPI0013174B4E|nr:glycoside hydrolase family protein [Variovorax sp. PBS-H4]VTU38211.1 Phage-related lysozyme (muraminidase) [Variovorax sp. PBS-H4]